MDCEPPRATGLQSLGLSRCSGAGEENRTPAGCLGSICSTFELHPRDVDSAGRRIPRAMRPHLEGTGDWPSRCCTGAGEGNRTPSLSLATRDSTFELHPRSWRREGRVGTCSYRDRAYTAGRGGGNRTPISRFGGGCPTVERHPYAHEVGSRRCRVERHPTMAREGLEPSGGASPARPPHVSIRSGRRDSNP